MPISSPLRPPPMVISLSPLPRVDLVDIARSLGRFAVVYRPRPRHLANPSDDPRNVSRVRPREAGNGRDADADAVPELAWQRENRRWRLAGRNRSRGVGFGRSAGGSRGLAS
jgi:hypothetical protein